MRVKDDIILTCAITGSGDSHLKHPGVPKSPEEIAKASIEAAKAGAAVVHIHVREPGTGTPCRRLDLYEETVKLIRESDTDVVINITTGIGGDFVPDDKDPSTAGLGTDMATPAQRVVHILKLKPEICTLDCGTFNDGANITYIATLDMLRETARLLMGTGVTPEIEAFDLGFIWQAKILLKEGLLPTNTIFQLCMGIPYGAEATTSATLAMRDHLPANVNWGAFGIGRNEFPMLAQSALLGGNVRVGLEDNIFLEKNQLASNTDLVVRAREIVEQLGGRLMNPDGARKVLKLIKQ